MSTSLIPDSLLTLRNKHSRLTTKYFDKQFKQAKCPINATQYDLLRLILNNGQDNLNALAREVGMERTTLSRRIPILVKQGYVSYVETIDKRNKKPELTEKGKKLVINFSDIYKKTDKECIKQTFVNDEIKALAKNDQ